MSPMSRNFVLCNAEVGVDETTRILKRCSVGLYRSQTPKLYCTSHLASHDRSVCTSKLAQTCLAQPVQDCMSKTRRALGIPSSWHCTSMALLYRASAVQKFDTVGENPNIDICMCDRTYVSISTRKGNM